MSYHSQTEFFSTMHVATNGDIARSGGYFEFSKSGRVRWPHLYMHVRLGGIDGAVWSNTDRSRFVLVQTDPSSWRLKKITEMNASELSAFKQRDGIFYILSN